MTVKVFTDSAADIPERYLKEYDLETVPTVIKFGDELFYEGRDLQLDEFYERFFNSKEYPQTANPTLQHQYEMYERLGKEADEVLNIVISSGISGSYNTAHVAKKNYERRVKDHAQVYIYDSTFASFGIGIIALKAAELAKEGKSAEEIILELDEYRKTIEIGFTVADLVYLHRGGRLSKSKYWIARIADMKPVINFIEGKMEVIKTVRGHENALIESFNTIYKKKGKPKKFNAYIIHARNPSSANFLKDYIEDKIKPEETNITAGQLGMTIVTHAGPGCIGICLDTENKFFDLS
ncbi:MAG: DegV family protein [Candidatus Heimdallarchaeaceae archaeon]